MSSKKSPWTGLFIAKIGLLGTALVSLHYGAQNHIWIKNLESVALHGPRKTAEGFYRGDAEVVTALNKEGDKEKYLVFLPSEKRYALGEDGYAKNPEVLLESLESRVNLLSGSEAMGMLDRLYNVETKIRAYYNTD